MKKILWMLYVILLSGTFVSALYFTPVVFLRSGFFKTIYIVLLLLIFLFGLLGVIGFVFKKSFFSNIFWRRFSMAFLIGGFCLQITIDLLRLQYFTISEVFFKVLSVPFEWWLILPYLFALFLYAFRSPDIWGKK